MSKFEDHALGCTIIKYDLKKKKKNLVQCEVVLLSPTTKVEMVCKDKRMNWKMRKNEVLVASEQMKLNFKMA